MNEKELLKSIGNIDDSFIEEAQPAASKQSKKGKIVLKKKWQKWSAGIAAALALTILIGTMANSGWFSLNKEGADQSSPKDGYQAAESSGRLDSQYGVEYETVGSNLAAYSKTEYDYQKADSNKSDTSSSGIYTAKDVKLIYRASLSAQTNDFEKADAELKAAVDALGGYFENQSISNNGNYYNGEFLKKAQYTVRIPAEHYNDFINQSSELMTVKSIDQTVEDVGLAYSENEQHLETLYIKLDRLQELLKEAGDLSDIITLENEISDTEYAIEYYKNTLNRYDSLIGFSTVTITLYEVARPGTGVDKKEGFFAKLGRNFADGLENAGENFADVFYWISYNFIGILIFAAVVFVLIKFKPIRKLWKKIRHID